MTRIYDGAIPGKGGISYIITFNVFESGNTGEIVASPSLEQIYPDLGEVLAKIKALRYIHEVTTEVATAVAFAFRRPGIVIVVKRRFGLVDVQAVIDKVAEILRREARPGVHFTQAGARSS